MDERRCFRCKEPGHLSGDCPNRTRRQAAHPPAAPEGAPEWRGNPVPPRRPDEEISQNTHEWANHARDLLGQLPHCGDPADIYTSPFRRAARLGPIHRCQLRQIAAKQLEEIHQ